MRNENWQIRMENGELGNGKIINCLLRLFVLVLVLAFGLVWLSPHPSVVCLTLGYFRRVVLIGYPIKCKTMFSFHLNFDILLRRIKRSDRTDWLYTLSYLQFDTAYLKSFVINFIYFTESVCCLYLACFNDPFSFVLIPKCLYKSVGELRVLSCWYTYLPWLRKTALIGCDVVVTVKANHFVDFL